MTRNARQSLRDLAQAVLANSPVAAIEPQEVELTVMVFLTATIDPDDPEAYDTEQDALRAAHDSVLRALIDSRRGGTFRRHRSYGEVPEGGGEWVVYGVEATADRTT